MAVKATKVAPKPVKARRGPLAHSGNQYRPAVDFVASLKGKERAYAAARVEYITHLVIAAKPASPLSPERTREIDRALLDLFSNEDSE